MVLTSRPRPLRVLTWVLAAPLVVLERTPPRLRPFLALIYGLAALVPLVVVGRAAGLRAVPDVGAPPGAATLRSEIVPDDQDARFLYESAIGTARPVVFGESLDEDWAAGGLPKGPITDWIQRERNALDLWRLAAERPRIAPGSPLIDDDRFRWLALLARAEGERHRNLSQMEDSWTWIRALLRASRHIGIVGGPVGRSEGATLHARAADDAETWAADPEADAKLLRGALADVLKVGALTRPPSHAFLVAYLDVEDRLAEVPPESKEEVFGEYVGLPAEAPLYRQFRAYPAFRWFLEYEPERSRRLVRLVFGNWLAHCDEPAGARPAFATTEPPLFPIGPRDPIAARALAPEDLAGRFNAPGLAKWLIGDGPADLLPVLDRERARQARLVIAIARELYRREHHNKLPLSDDELIGPYLESFPEGYVAPPPLPLRPGSANPYR